MLCKILCILLLAWLAFPVVRDGAGGKISWMQSVTGAAHLQQPFQRIAQETQIPHFSIQFPGKTFQIQLMTKVELFETAGMGKLFSTVDWFEETLISSPGFCEISTQNKSALLRRARVFTTATHNAPRLEVCACNCPSSQCITGHGITIQWIMQDTMRIHFFLWKYIILRI